MTPLEHTIVALAVMAASFYWGRASGTTTGIEKCLIWALDEGLISSKQLEKYQK